MRLQLKTEWRVGGVINGKPTIKIREMITQLKVKISCKTQGILIKVRRWSWKISIHQFASPCMPIIPISRDDSIRIVRRNRSVGENKISAGQAPMYNGFRHQQTTEKIRSCHASAAEYSLDVARVVQAGLEARCNVVPCALVLVLLLGPDDFGVRVFGAFSFHQIVWERWDLKRNKL